MWLLLVSLHFITSFHRVSLNAIADRLTAEFALTGAGLGNLAAAYTYMYVLMQIPGGLLVDRLGPRKIAFLTGTVMALGSVVIALAPNPGAVFLGRLLIGFGGSVILINVFKFQAAWFKVTEFATLSGLALLISTSGSLLATTPFAYAVNLYGWRAVFAGLGLLTLFVAFTALTAVRNNPSQLSYNGSNSFLHAAEPERFSFRQIQTVMGNRKIWLPFLLNFGVYGGFMVFAGTWGVSYLVHIYRFSVEEASQLMILANLGYMIGAPVAGNLSDRLGSRRIPAIFLVFLAICSWLCLILYPGGILPRWILNVISVMIGMSGSANVLSFPMARDVSISGCTGLVTSTVNLGVFMGMALLQPLFGMILDRGWSGLLVDGVRIYTLEAYRYGFMLTLSFAFFALLAMLVYHEGKGVAGKKEAR